MVSVLYTLERPFMRKTYEAIDEYIDLSSAYLPILPESSGSCEEIAAIEPKTYDTATVDAAVRAVGPDVVVRNHRYQRGSMSSIGNTHSPTSATAPRSGGERLRTRSNQ